MVSRAKVIICPVFIKRLLNSREWSLILADRNVKTTKQKASKCSLFVTNGNLDATNGRTNVINGRTNTTNGERNATKRKMNGHFHGSSNPAPCPCLRDKALQNHCTSD